MLLSPGGLAPHPKGNHGPTVAFFKLGFGITAGLFPVVTYFGDAPDEFYDYEAVGFYNDHENGAIFSVLDNSGDQFITLFQNVP